MDTDCFVGGCIRAVPWPSVANSRRAHPGSRRWGYVPTSVPASPGRLAECAPDAAPWPGGRTL